MRWYKPLYFGESINTERKQKRVLNKLTKNVLQPNIFIIVLNELGRDIFRIIPSMELLQKNYPKDDLLVVGVARSKEEALSLVETMVSEVYSKDGNLDHIKEHFVVGRLNR